MSEHKAKMFHSGSGKVIERKSLPKEEWDAGIRRANWFRGALQRALDEAGEPPPEMNEFIANRFLELV